MARNKFRSFQGEFLLFYLEEAHDFSSEEEIAFEVFGVSKSQFSKWMHGRSKPERRNLVTAARYIYKHGAIESDLADFQSNFLRSFAYLARKNDGALKFSEVSPTLAKLYLDYIGEHSQPNGKSTPLVHPDYISENVAFTEDPTSAVWLNPHNHYSLPLVGRQTEIELLDEFMTSGEQKRLQIAAIIGPSGAGKTRLISEWARTYIDGDKSDKWDAGFAESNDASLWSAEKWTPLRDTLIIIDYTYSYGQVIGALIDRFKDKPPHDIRLLIIDHVLPDRLHEDSVWKSGVPSLKFQEAHNELFFRLWPIYIKPTQDISGFLRDVIAAASDPFSRIKRFSGDSTRIIAAADALMSIGASDEESLSSNISRTENAVRHPLFAALIGQMIYQDRDLELAGMSRRDLIQHYFGSALRLPWKEGAKRPDLGFWVGLYVSAATLLRGLSINDIFEFQDVLPETSRRPVSDKDFDSILEICRRFVSSNDTEIISPFEPDILGESFFLKFLSKHRSANDLQTLAALLEVGCQSGSVETPVVFFLETIQRTVRNLINDDQELGDIESSWKTLIRFLDPKWFAKDSELRQAISIALGDIVKQLRLAKLNKHVRAFSIRINARDLVNASSSERFKGASLAVVHCIESHIEYGELAAHSEVEFFEVIRNFKLKSQKNWSAMMLAASEGCVNAAKHMQSTFRENVNDTNDAGWTSIMIAASLGHDSIVRFLHERGADLETTDLRGWNACRLATRHRHSKTTQCLALLGADLNASDHNGLSVALLASYNGDLGLLRFLFENDVDLRMTNNNGSNAVMLACRYGHLEVLRFLHECGLELGLTTDKHGNNSAMYAAVEGKLEILQFLYDHGVDLSGSDAYGNTLLLKACEKGYAEVLNFLIEVGLNLYAVNLYGKGAVRIASENGQAHILALLHSHGVDLDMPDERGYTLIQRLAMGLDVLKGDGQYELAKADSDLAVELIQLGIGIEARDKNNRSPLHLAARFFQPAVAEALIKAGADVNSKNNELATPLHDACFSGCVDIAKMLIESCVEIDCKDRFEWSPLHIASISGSLEIVKLLVENGAAVNSFAGSPSYTPLQAAASTGQIDICTYLIRSGVEVSLCKYEMDEAYILACLNMMPDCAKLIISEQNPQHENWRDIINCIKVNHRQRSSYVKNQKVFIESQWDIK